MNAIVDSKYKRVIYLINKREVVNLNTCRIYCPDISSGTFHSILNKLNKHGLVSKSSKNNEGTTYRKTTEFTIEKAIEVIKSDRAISIEKERAGRLEDNVRQTVSQIIDPATGLTFAEMQIIVNVKEKEPGVVQVEFIPPFCSVAQEFTAYIENATMRVFGIKRASIRCCGQSCERQINREYTKANQGNKLVSAKGLLEYLK